MNEMMRRGVKRELVEEEFPAVEVYDEARGLSDKLINAWDVEVKKRGVKRARLWMALLRSFGPQYSLAGLAYFLEVIFATLSSIFLGYLLQWFQNPIGTAREGYLWAMAISLSTFVHAVLHHCEFYMVSVGRLGGGWGVGVGGGWGLAGLWLGGVWVGV
ncbi:hypothetical protein HDV00_011632 [Rhizophlyctis rosea]|nr:hypothetical protein HDV00_011632 [Rhizophlyctis rosea]